MADIVHISRVRVLYKTILRLHRGLPPDLKLFGDEYVKDEFKRHKNASVQFVPVFMNEWMVYAKSLAGQLGQKSSYKHLGIPLPEEKFSAMSNEQIAQLFELFREAQQPTSTPLASSSSHASLDTIASSSATFSASTSSLASSSAVKATLTSPALSSSPSQDSGLAQPTI